MSELFINRKEIRRRVLARLGFTTNDSQAPLNLDQINEFIRSAAETVYLRCPWSQAMRETRVSIGIDQRRLNYPAQVGPGNIQAIGLWLADEQRYVPLRRGRIPVELDDDPVVDIGEPDSVANRGRPELYELKKQIELWRRPDQAYELKLDHTISPNFENDSDVSVVDGEAIILWAMADAYDFQGDERLAQVARGKFEERIRLLINDQSPLTQYKRGRFDRLSVAARRDTYMPDSGQWPSRMPS